MRRSRSSDISRDKSYLQLACHFHDALPASCASQWEPRTAIVYIERSLPVDRKRRTSRWGRETPELDRRGALRANLPASLSLCPSHVAVSSWMKRCVEMVTLAARFKPRGMETRRREKEVEDGWHGDEGSDAPTSITANPGRFPPSLFLSSSSSSHRPFHVTNANSP